VVRASLEDASIHIVTFKNTFLSRYLEQNMLKNALFFEKAGKIAAALGDPPPKPPLACGGWGFSPQTPPPPSYVTSTQFRVAFEQCSNFLASLKLRSFISYLGDN